MIPSKTYITLNEGQKTRWKESIKIIRRERYACIHKLYSDTDGWCKLTYKDKEVILHCDMLPVGVYAMLEKYLSFHEADKK